MMHFIKTIIIVFKCSDYYTNVQMITIARADETKSTLYLCLVEHLDIY